MLAAACCSVSLFCTSSRATAVEMACWRAWSESRIKVRASASWPLWASAKMRSSASQNWTSESRRRHVKLAVEVTLHVQVGRGPGHTAQSGPQVGQAVALAGHLPDQRVLGVAGLGYHEAPRHLRVG